MLCESESSVVHSNLSSVFGKYNLQYPSQGTWREEKSNFLSPLQYCLNFRLTTVPCVCHLHMAECRSCHLHYASKSNVHPFRGLQCLSLSCLLLPQPPLLTPYIIYGQLFASCWHQMLPAKAVTSLCPLERTGAASFLPASPALRVPPSLGVWYNLPLFLHTRYSS